MRTTQIAALAAALAGAAVGLAGPASADPPSGIYTATVIHGGGAFEEGSTATWNLTPCGPDCIHVDWGDLVLRLQGNSWNGRWGNSDSCTAALDNSSLVLTEQCPGYPDMVVGLTR